MFHDSDTSERIQRVSFTSYKISEIEDLVIKDDPLCNDNQNKSNFFENDWYESVTSDENQHPPSRSKSDSKSLLYKPKSSSFQSFNKFPELLDIPNKVTIYDSPTSLANQSKSSLHYNQS